MSFYIINSEYDMDNTLTECIKLMSFPYSDEESKLKVAFKNMGMVNIFLQNLMSACEELEIDPDETEFSLDVLVDTHAAEGGEDESTGYV